MADVPVADVPVADVIGPRPSKGPRPTGLEIASGMVTGPVSPAVTTRSVPTRSVPTRTVPSPLAALEDAIRPALRRPPCVVSFSGGMDSSFVLAVAVRLARREGLPDPVPLTWRFIDAPHAAESPWQERVVAALGVTGWTRLIAADDLDLVAPVAQRVLSRYGVVHPPNLHLHLPIIEAAVGGSLLTGVGGDQILAGWRHQARPTTRTAALAPVVRARVPGRVVAAVRQRQGRDPFPWLWPAAARRVMREHRRDQHAEPRRIDRRIEWHARRRSLVLGTATLTAVGADHDVAVAHPLVDPRFRAALGHRFATAGSLTRAQLLLAIADGALPEAATAARPKAHFLEVFLRAPTREFVRSWDGRGVDPEFVDADALRQLWSHWPIPPGTAGLVQQAWLAGPSAGTADRTTTATAVAAGNPERGRHR